MNSWCATKHRQVARDPERIRQSPLMQRAPKRGDISEFGVRHDGRHAQARGAGASNQGQCLAPFFLERRPGRNAGRRPSSRILDPGLRQIQQRTQQPRTGTGPERGSHRDLAIGDLAQRTAILPRHPDGVQPLLREARAVEDHHAAALRQDLQQAAPDAIGVPRRMRDEMLKRLIGDGLRDARQHRLQ